MHHSQKQNIELQWNHVELYSIIHSKQHEYQLRVSNSLSNKQDKVHNCNLRILKITLSSISCVEHPIIVL